MPDFKDKFGLDFLIEKKQATNQANQRSGATLPPGLEDALLAYGGKVVTVLKHSPGQQRSLFELVDQTGTRIDTLLQVVNYLESKGYITRVTQDPKGNDTFQLTEAGEKVPA